jgi:sigma-B regulation protein RsbU (phosphoserine phosphatase)
MSSHVPQTVDPPAPTEPTQSSTILLVDDDALIRKVIARRLRQLGHRLIEAENGLEGLRLARREHPSVIVTDWMMPVMDGPSLCEAIRTETSLRPCHLILLTANGSPDQIVEGLQRGADDYLSKSSTAQEMIARVQAGLRTAGLMRELEHTHAALAQSYDLLAYKQHHLESELHSAATFIESLLPDPGVVIPGSMLAWQYLPSLTLGGDLFDVRPWGPESLGLYILDASGHGVNAALRAASLSTLLRADGLPQQIASEDPGEILTTLNRRYPITSEGHYFTIWIGCLHVPTGELRFSTAGHAGALAIRSRGDMESLSRASFPLGFKAETRYATSTIILGPDDRLLLFSDGLYEGASPQDERWGLTRFKEAVQQSRALPLEASLRQVIQHARAWQQRDHFDDDAALLGLELRG